MALNSMKNHQVYMAQKKKKTANTLPAHNTDATQSRFENDDDDDDGGEKCVCVL